MRVEVAGLTAGLSRLRQIFDRGMVRCKAGALR